MIITVNNGIIHTQHRL